MKKIILLISILFFVVFPLFAYDYTIEKLAVDISVGKNAVHSISEYYKMFFYNSKHGIIRSVPVTYIQDDLKVHAKIYDIVCSDPVETDTEDNLFLFQIGSADRKVKGNKSYRLSYKYDLPEDTNQGYDQFYFNLLGDGWDCPVEDFEFTVKIPAKTDEILSLDITKGYYGSVDKVPYTVTESPDGVVVSGKVSGLNPQEAVTMMVQFPDSWYQGARKVWDYRGQAKIATYALCLVCLGLGLIVVMKNGKQTPLIVTAQFEPPAGFDPAMAAQVINGEFGQRDLTAMIFYWADKGYIKIVEKTKGYYSFIKLRNLPEFALSHERELFNGFFANSDESGEIDIKKINSSSFYKKVETAKSSLSSFFTKEKSIHSAEGAGGRRLLSLLSLLPLISGAATVILHEFGLVYLRFCIIAIVVYKVFNSSVMKSDIKKKKSSSGSYSFFSCMGPTVMLIAVLIILRFLLEIEFEPIPVVIAVICSFVVSYFGTLCVYMTEYGRKITEHLLGLKEFISKAEIDQLKRMIDSNPQYYYHILSYAIVFNLEDKWAKKFSDIKLEQPSWYQSDYGLLNAYIYGSMLSQMSRSLNLSRMAIKSSGGTARIGGGGFRSSGFSGGGFGGGGGRAW